MQRISAEISILLEKTCSAIIGDHHISSFPSAKNQYGMRFPVVMVHFLLKVDKQKVKGKAAPVHSVWQSNDEDKGEELNDFKSPPGYAGLKRPCPH